MFKNLTFKVQKFKVQCFGRKGQKAQRLEVILGLLACLPSSLSAFQPFICVPNRTLRAIPYFRVLYRFHDQTI